MLGKIEGGRRRGRQRMRWVDGIPDSMDVSLSKLMFTLGVGDGQGGLVCCSPWGRKESDVTERLNWNCGHQRSENSILNKSVCLSSNTSSCITSVSPLCSPTGYPVR